jgi:hypothetical protein
MRSLFSAVAALALFATTAAAQTPPPATRAFATFNFGYQAQSQDISQNGEFSLYQEAGTFSATHAIDGGPFFEIGGGYQILRNYPNFSVGLSYARRSGNSRDVTVAARVPHPLFPEEPRDASATVTDLEHKERAVHVQAMWTVPVTVEFDVTVFAGPSFFTVEEDLIESITPTEVDDSFSQVNIEPVGISHQKESAVGFNLGVDGRYMFTRNIGAGAMLRFTHAGVSLTSPTGGDDIKVDAGGFEIAAGLRFRF